MVNIAGDLRLNRQSAKLKSLPNTCIGLYIYGILFTVDILH